jgi:protein-disulfide isomerase
MKLFVAAVLAVVLSPVIAAAQGFPSQYPIKADDGDKIANFTLPADKLAKINALAGQVPVGNLKGDVTVMQFYDLNCPYCREAAHDIDALVQGDPKLKLIFVPYAVLSVQSVQGALIELGAAKMLNAEQYRDFHRRLYANRGLIDGPRALAVAKDMGLDPAKVSAAANTEANLNILRDSATIGGDAGLQVTPAYVVGGVAVIGHPGLKPLQKIVAAMRQCGKVVC